MKYAGVSLLLICLIVSISIFGVKKQVGGFLALFFFLSFCFLIVNCVNGKYLVNKPRH